LGAGQPPQPERKPETQQARADPAKSETASDAERHAAEYEQPCKGQERNRNSDLCAQWTAADAARDAADWSYVGLWLTGASVAGLLITLWFNYAAWDQARKGKNDTARALIAAERSATAANRLADTAERNAERQLRAYLDFDGIRADPVELYAGKPPPAGQKVLRLMVSIRNYGSTPAENVHTSLISKIRHCSSNTTTDLKVDEKVVSVVAPRDVFHLRYIRLIPDEVLANIESAELISRECLIVTYTDVFGQPHVLRANFEGIGIRDEFSVLEGSRVST
jgi:hypothetical protein